MIKLILGDCLEEMKNIPNDSIDMVLTDPPYGITACKWDIIIPFIPMWEQLLRITKKSAAIVLFSNEPFSSALRMSNIKMYKYDLVWNKRSTTGFLNAKIMPLRQHEDIIIFCKHITIYNPIMRLGVLREKGGGKKSEVYNNTKPTQNFNDQYYPTSILEFYGGQNKQKLHPTQKPVNLMSYLIKTYTNEGNVVLDFTMGSGTTGVACKNLNRSFIGIEKEKKYFDIATERINNTNRLFGG